MTPEQILDAIKQLSVLDLAKLVKAIEQEFGVSAAAPMAVAPTVGGAPVVEAAPVEEQTEFAVVLKEIGPEKIKVIKEVRAFTTLGLKEAKELVESAPAVVREGVSKEEAQKIREALEAVGATVEVK